MKLIRTEDAAGQVLCHDITQIIPGQFKGARFRKGHIVQPEDIPVLLSIGKENLYVWEKRPGILHEDEEFTPRALYYARRIQYLPVRVYNYLQRSDSFMGNYKPQSRLDLVRAMKSLTCFASRIGAEDPSGARLMHLHVGKTLSLACKQTVVRQLGNAREMLREARRQGIMPLQFRRRDFRHFLINRLPGLYVLYYKLHKRQK